jgi:polyhydroxybutyrate depolymerase
MESLTRFDAQADAEGFIVVYPEGVGRTWNAGFCCGDAQEEEVDDLGFLAQLVQTVGAERAVDRDRVYVAGFSNGGYMAYRAACERPDTLAAVASVAGTLPDFFDCRPSRALGVLEIHGTADAVVPYEGRCRPERCVPSSERVVEEWSERDGCRESPRVRIRGRVTSTRWASCRSGSAVRLYVIAGGTHTWPGRGEGPDAALDATAAVWSFFAGQRRRAV